MATAKMEVCVLTADKTTFTHWMGHVMDNTKVVACIISRQTDLDLYNFHKNCPNLVDHVMDNHGGLIISRQTDTILDLLTLMLY